MGNPGFGPLAKSRKGDERVSEILDVTLELLSKQGYAAISLANVARQANIAKANVQYYFPTRDQLLRSALEIQVEQLKGLWRKAAGGTDGDPWKKLFRVVDEDIAICKSDTRTALALEKWAYAARDGKAQDIFRGWHDWVTDLHADILAELRPDLSEHERQLLAVLITSLLEGMWPFFGRSRVRKPGMENFEQQLKQSLRNLIEGFHGARNDHATTHPADV